MDDGSDVLLNFLHNQLETMINVQSLPEMTKCLTHRGGGGGTWDFANPTHATMPTARIVHPNMSYLRSLLFFYFEDVLEPDEVEGPAAPIVCSAKPCLWISMCNSGALATTSKDLQ